MERAYKFRIYWKHTGKVSRWVYDSEVIEIRALNVMEAWLTIPDHFAGKPMTWEVTSVKALGG